jgi:coproporphyrinogen III oxidase-like Fe-S oxidoreductase
MAVVPPGSSVLPELDLGALLARHPELQIEQDDYNINVTANFGRRLDAAEVMRRYAEHPGAGAPAHLYFHVPLCSYICHFCNYVKRRLSEAEGDEMLERWTDWLVTESSAYLDEVGWLSAARIESLFLGGGTAALLRPHQLERILDHVRARYQLSGDCELTLEGNPDNYTADYVEAVLALGFNRFSVGVQSFTDEVNEFTGRGHDSAASLAAIDALRSTGRPFNVDLMFGLPRQTPETVERDLRTVVEREVPTITIYRLRNSDRQGMGIGNRAAWNVASVRDRLHREGAFPSLEETYAMRAAAVAVLLEHDYRPSPCGWWNAPGTYPDGNIPRVSRNKWQNYDTMVAFGPGAYGWLTGNGSEVLQTHNEADIAGYVRRRAAGDHRPIAFGRLLDGEAALGSALGFAFKANQPIDLERFATRFGVDLLADEPTRAVFEELLDKGLVEMASDGASVQPTLEGEALHEEIISVYMHGRIGGHSAPVCRRT